MQVRELGHLVLYVKDLDRSVRFYRDVLGFQPIGRFGDVGMAFRGTDGRTHHELLLLEVGADAPGPLTGRRAGLYHFGLKVGDSDEELRDAIETLQRAGVPITGAADHHVTHSVYILDPDGNEIELYVDVLPREAWQADPALIMRPPAPLRL